MTDFKNNPEITQNIEHFIDDGSEIKISLVICVWNTSHLLVRSVETYCKQNVPANLFEIIVVDDASEDNVQEAIQFAIGKINLRYIRLEHKWGMRGNCCSFNTGFAWSRGSILAESTPETLFTPDTIKTLYTQHLTNPRCFVSMKTYNLVHWMQLKIDTVDWRSDLMNISKLEGWNEPWVQNNVANTNFGTHQTCSILKSVFYEIFPNGFPLFNDYGSEDPTYHNRRIKNGVQGITIMQPMLFHQWHHSWSYWGCKGKSPNTNKYGHSLSNYMHDTSGLVPEAGTSEIWDKIDKPDWREGYGAKEKAELDSFKCPEGTWDEIVRATGCKLV